MKGTVSIVLVSHSARLAEGVAEMTRQIGSDAVAVLTAGGTDDGDLGTSSTLVERTLAEADRGAGVVILPDLGSSVLTTRAVLEEREGGDAVLVDTAFVEGAVAAAVTAATGASLDEVVAAAEEARHVRKL